MYISKFQLINYKSYQDSNEIELAPGVNIVVGPNNAGKTALLEGLSLKFTFKPHHGSSAGVKSGSAESRSSKAIVWLSPSREDLFEIVGDMDSFAVPLPDSETLYHLNNKEALTPVEHVSRFIERLFSTERFTIQVAVVATRRQQEPQLTPTKFPSLGNYQAAGDGNDRSYAICRINREGKLVVDAIQEGNSQPELDFGLSVARELLKRVYSFRAERVPDPTYPSGLSDYLDTNAANLADALGNLQSDPVRFRDLNEHLRYVLPHVHEVAVRNVASDGRIPGVHRQVIVFEENSAAPVALSDSGTGVSQVLSMLYVLVNSDRRQTIVIDEPQSFLHPRAVRKLFEVISFYPQHQYVVSTHAPNVISAADPPGLLMVTKVRGQQSSIRHIDPADTEQLRLALHDVGARLGDVFGADYILWVEGKTERDCFPMILKKLDPGRSMGTEFVPVLSPDETLGRNADHVLSIYRQIGEGSGLLPQAAGFIFDRECRTDAQVKELERRAGRTVKFIARRMYENYLIHPQAILSVLVGSGLEGSQVSADAIQAWIDAELGKDEYYCRKIERRDPWVKYVDGSKLLTNLFTHFSGSTLFYESKKVRYGVQLTRWLLENGAHDFEEIAGLIRALLPANDALIT